MDGRTARRKHAPTRCTQTTRASRGARHRRSTIPEPGRRSDNDVRDDMVNGFDICHGGIIFALADTAFAFACNAYDRLTVAASASIEFVRPARAGDDAARDCERRASRGSTGYYSDRGEQPGWRQTRRAVPRPVSVSNEQPLLELTAKVIQKLLERKKM